MTRNMSKSNSCDVYAILHNFGLEQREHTYADFGETYLKYRRVVAEWMIDVCEYFHLHITTTHAAIAYLDRLQPNEKFSRYEWQMLAICCILIASKYNECEEHVPDRRTLEDITQQSITNEIILSYELWALKRMGWKLNARTAMSFLSSYAELGLISEGDKASMLDCSEPAATLVSRLTQRMQAHATSSLLDPKFKAYKCSDVACAILAYTREEMGFATIWSPELAAVTEGNDPNRPEVAGIVEQLRGVNSRLAPAQTQTPVKQSSHTHQMSVEAPVTPVADQKQSLASPTSVNAQYSPDASSGSGSLGVHNKENLHYPVKRQSQLTSASDIDDAHQPELTGSRSAQ